MRTHTTIPFCALLLCLLVPVHAGLALPGEEEVSDDPEGEEGGPAVPPPTAVLFASGEASVPFQELPDSLPSISAQSCNACHGPVVEQWQGSGHGQAWHSPLYQEALTAAGEPTYCLRCHLPLQNQRSELVRGYNENSLAKPRLEPNPRFDPTLRAEGVTCAACHVRDGVVYGPRTLRPGESPHSVYHHPDLVEPVTCAACHQLAWPGTEEKPLYNTYREWEESPWAVAGVRCQDCHMPLTVGPVSGSRFAAHRSHEVRGSADDAVLARAFTVQVGPVPPEIQRGTELPVRVQVMNTGAGHHAPTGNPHSWIEVRIAADGVEGLDAEPGSWPLRRVVDLEGEHEAGEDTRIPAGGTATFDYLVAPSKRAKAPADLRITVELWYHQLPPELVEQYGKTPDEVSRLFHAQEIVIPLR